MLSDAAMLTPLNLVLLNSFRRSPHYSFGEGDFKGSLKCKRTFWRWKFWKGDSIWPASDKWITFPKHIGVEIFPLHPCHLKLLFLLFTWLRSTSDAAILINISLHCHKNTEEKMDCLSMLIIRNLLYIYPVPRIQIVIPSED